MKYALFSLDNKVCIFFFLHNVLPKSPIRKTTFYTEVIPVYILILP